MDFIPKERLSLQEKVGGIEIFFSPPFPIQLYHVTFLFHTLLLASLSSLLSLSLFPSLSLIPLFTAFSFLHLKREGVSEAISQITATISLTWLEWDKYIYHRRVREGRKWSYEFLPCKKVTEFLQAGESSLRWELPTEERKRCNERKDNERKSNEVSQKVLRVFIEITRVRGSKFNIIQEY